MGDYFHLEVSPVIPKPAPLIPRPMNEDFSKAPRKPPPPPPVTLRTMNENGELGKPERTPGWFSWMLGFCAGLVSGSMIVALARACA
jgi:hypothetical protein